MSEWINFSHMRQPAFSSIVAKKIMVNTEKKRKYFVHKDHKEKTGLLSV